MPAKSKDILETLYCEHRHTIDSHPHCFLMGNVGTKISNMYAKFTGKPWYTYPGYKIGYFDIEVDNLRADYGTMLTWTIKGKGSDKFVTGKITQKELFNGTTDKRIVEEFIKEMQEYAILVGFYSSRFDIPYVRTRALIHNVEFPPYGRPYHFDLYYTVRNKFALSRNGLGRAVEVLLPEEEGKTHCSASTWALAKYGNPIAIDEILEYNKQDVAVTEKLHDRISPFATWPRRSI